jgi:hypothetical protein
LARVGSEAASKAEASQGFAPGGREDEYRIASDERQRGTL